MKTFFNAWIMVMIFLIGAMVADIADTMNEVAKDCRPIAAKEEPK